MDRFNYLRLALSDIFDKHHGDDGIPPLESDPNTEDYNFDDLGMEDKDE